jgi:hypothetical protein
MHEELYSSSGSKNNTGILVAIDVLTVIEG